MLSRGDTAPPGVRFGGWAVGYPGLADASGEDCSGEVRFGRLRGRARISDDRPPYHAPQCAQGFLRGRGAHDASARLRGYYRQTHSRSRVAAAAASERSARRGDATSHRQQPADHCQHPPAEGEHRKIRGNAPASSGCPQARHVGCSGATAPSGFRAGRADRGGAVPDEAVRDPGAIDDRGQPADPIADRGRRRLAGVRARLSASV